MCTLLLQSWIFPSCGTNEDNLSLSFRNVIVSAATTAWLFWPFLFYSTSVWSDRPALPSFDPTAKVKEALMMDIEICNPSGEDTGSLWCRKEGTLKFSRSILQSPWPRFVKTSARRRPRTVNIRIRLSPVPSGTCWYLSLSGKAGGLNQSTTNNLNWDGGNLDRRIVMTQDTEILPDNPETSLGWRLED